nr:seminal fluid protein HACP059 [Hymenolepis microstoma]
MDKKELGIGVSSPDNQEQWKLCRFTNAKGPQGDTAKEICEALVGRSKKHTCTVDADYREVNERFSFVIFLPQEDFVFFYYIEEAIKDGDFQWNKVANQDNLQQMELILPMFKVEHKLDLKPILQLLGINSIFSPGGANLRDKLSSPHEMINFSNSCIKPLRMSPDTDLCVSDAKQGAMLKIDEGGARAAAIAGLQVDMKSLFPPTPIHC